VSRLKSGVLNLLVVLVSIALTLLAAEIALRFLPVATALPVEPPTAENPIQRYVADHPYTWSFDWNMVRVVRGRSNAQGFLANYDYDASDPRPLIAVVGDSYMESLRVPFAESLTGRLQTVLGDRARAYVFAQSGSPLSQYVAYARHACMVYRPVRLVVTVVGNDFDESIFTHRVRNGIFHLHPVANGGFDHVLTPLPEPGLAERILRRSALALYLIRNVGITNVIADLGINLARADPRQGGRYVGQVDADANPKRIEEGHHVIDWFLGELPRAACLAPNNVVIVVDTARPEVYEPSMLAATQTSYFGQMRRRILEQAKARGFRVIDTEQYFIAAYTLDGKRFEHPSDGHWNAHAHGVVTTAVRDALADWPPLAATTAFPPN
jgi:hypothetical protein